MNVRSGKRFVVLIVSAIVGCQGGESGDYAFEAGIHGDGDEMTTTAESKGSDGSRAGADDGDSTGGEDEGDDATDDADEPGLPTEPCSALDVVFVVNNTYTMLDEQVRLREAAATFVDQLAEQVPEVMGDIQVGVLTTDDQRFVATTSACEVPYASGASYMVFGETMNDELGCSLDVGVGGDPDERPAQMLLGALSDDLRKPGAFHDGFIRDNALLVVVVATDEDDRHDAVTGWGSAGDPGDWVDALAGVKGGHVEDVVVLSLVGTPKPNACPEYQWNGHDGAEIATRLIELTEAFPNGAVGDLCSLEYGTFLLGQVPNVAAACTDFIAP